MSDFILSYAAWERQEKQIKELEQKLSEAEKARQRPAPCLNNCEATAFKIVIKNLEAKLADAEKVKANYEMVIDNLKVKLALSSRKTLGETKHWGDDDE